MLPMVTVSGLPMIQFGDAMAERVNMRVTTEETPHIRLLHVTMKYISTLLKRKLPQQEEFDLYNKIVSEKIMLESDRYFMSSVELQ